MSHNVDKEKALNNIAVTRWSLKIDYGHGRVVFPEFFKVVSVSF